MPLPILETARLVLRGFSLADANRVQHLAGSRDVATTTINLPHPYEDGVAEAWIQGHAGAWEDRARLTLAITTGRDGVVGAISMQIVPDHRRGELGYWIGEPYWGQGFATEAAGAIVRYGFEMLGLHRIMARHLSRNPASGNVLRKIGMIHEGTQRGHVIKAGTPEDLECFAILEDEWRMSGASPAA